MAAPALTLEYRGRVAVITLANEAKLNALRQADYYDLACRLREVAARADVAVTVLLARGRYFSSGADVGSLGDVGDGFVDPEAAAAAAAGSHRHWLANFVANNLNVTHAFATHPKILVVGLNGPVVGLSAALVAFADFIYAVPHTFLLAPFSALGLVAEGGASRVLVRRLGLAKANEALLMSKRLPVRDLEACGFVNEVFPFAEGEDAAFRARVLAEVDDRLGDHVNHESILAIKKLIHGPDMDAIHSLNVNEVFAGLDRFVTGIPQQEFRKLATGQKRHKL